MKFIEVTELNGSAHLINLDHITDIVCEDGEFTTIYLDVHEKWCEGRDQVRLHAKETYNELKGRIRQAQAEQEGRV